MKKLLRLTALAALVLALGSAGTVHAEILPPHGEGQIGLEAVVLCEELTVRQQPSASSKAVMTLSYGDAIIVQPETGGWAACFLSDSVDGGRAGWVNENYLAIDPAWFRTEEKTPVYAWGDEFAPRVALLDADTTLPILKAEGDWLVVSLRGASGWIQAAETPEDAARAERRDGERFEGTVMVEGMEEAVQYEHIVNDAIGIEMDYDCERFERRHEADRERLISSYDDPASPLNTLEIRRDAEDADAVCASIIEALSGEYDVVQEPYALEGAGSCTHIEAARGQGAAASLLQDVYIIPDGDGCVVATMLYTLESAEGFGARMRQALNTLAITGGRGA